MIAAVLACRNKSSRLYGKPLQNLDVEKGVTILDFMIAQLSRRPEIDHIVLAISENEENVMYKSIAENKGIKYVLGDDTDVLGRLLQGAEAVGAEHVFRVTTESPYIYLDNLDEIASRHCAEEHDYSYVGGLPDGAYYEIISHSALKFSWDKGEPRHRSELCTLYIKENEEKFNIAQYKAPQDLCRQDVRLTVDWPEDLIVMRQIYEDLRLAPEKQVSIKKIISYLDEHPEINRVNNWIDSGQGRIWF